MTFLDFGNPTPVSEIKSESDEIQNKVIDP